MPTACGGQALAERAENWAESAITAQPQTSSASTQTTQPARLASSGYSRHIAPEVASATAATRALPKRPLSRPARMQPSAPTAMTANDSADTRRGCDATATPERRTAVRTRNGATVQNAYSSHMCPK